MDNRRLIAQYIMDYAPLRIARKNRIKEVKSNPFRCWARKKWNEFEEETEKAEQMLHRYPFAFLIGVLLDQQKLTWEAWRGPYLLKSNLCIKSFTPKAFSLIPLNRLEKAIDSSKLGCITMPKEKAAECIKNAANKIIK